MGAAEDEDAGWLGEAIGMVESEGAGWLGDAVGKAAWGLAAQPAINAATSTMLAPLGFDILCFGLAGIAGLISRPPH